MCSNVNKKLRVDVTEYLYHKDEKWKNIEFNLSLNEDTENEDLIKMFLLKLTLKA